MLLIEKIAQTKNLNYAWRFVKKKGKSGGIDQQSLNDYEKDLDLNLKKLSEELIDHKYTPDPSLLCKIPKSNNRYRDISIITIKDKIAQKAFVSLAQPILEKKFSHTSYAYRPAKGHQKALRQILHNINNLHNIYFQTADIRNFFDDIDHEILLNLIEKELTKEPEILFLIKLWLKIGKIEYNKYQENERGVPQGFVISPLLANLYLNEFDHLWQQENCQYIRYADNFIWATKEKKILEPTFVKAKEYLSQKRKLKINYSEYQLTSLDKGFCFLGIFFQNKKIKIANRKMKKANNKIYKIASNNRWTKSDKLMRINQATFSWIYYYRIVENNEQKQILDYWIIENFKKNGFLSNELFQINFMSKNYKEIIQGKLSFSDSLEKIENYIKNKPLSPENLLKNQLRNKRKFYKKKLNLDGEFLLIRNGTNIRLHQNCIAVSHDDFKTEIPLNKIKVIQIPANRASITTDLITKCSSYGIPIFLSDKFGNPKSQILPNQFSYVRRIMKQIEFSNNENGLLLSKTLIQAKIKNQLKVIQYFGKYWSKRSFKFQDDLKIYKLHVESIIKKIENLENTENYANVIMGYEGSCASLYWGLFSIIIKNPQFKRQKKSATDIINSMLNYGYGILYHRITRKIINMGLNPCCGFLHKNDNNRPSLVFDLIEPFRAIAVDRVVMSSININLKIELNNNGFLSDDSKHKIAKQFLNRLHSRFNHKNSDTSINDQINLLVENYVKTIQTNSILKPFIWFY